MVLFAERYIQNNVVYPPFISDEVLPLLSMIVMIPCLNEPDIVKTLESLWNCTPIESPCEVIVAVNHSQSSSDEVKSFNQKTFERLKKWKLKNDRPNFVLYPIFVPDVNQKFAGAGMARKIGMDEAIRRFNAVNKPDGVIVSLDSDCLVSSNYMQQIESVFTKDKACFAATIHFKHRIEEMKDEKQRIGIKLYEDYLHYYKKALDFAGFPDSIYTIGSAFAVRAEAYVKQGGMNRRKAGEDFYFLNKLTKLGKIKEIREAIVFPSARVSDRVPFGTGAAMSKWMKEEDDLTLTYNFAAFQNLKCLFDQVDSFFRITAEELSVRMSSLPDSIHQYLQSIDFKSKLSEVNQNSSSLFSFRKRFFQFFDGFVILRFLNFAHQNYYLRQDLPEAIQLLRRNSDLK